VRILSLLLALLVLTACGGNANPNPDPNPDPDPDGNGLVSTSQLGILLLLEGHVKLELIDIPVDIPQEVPKVTYAFANFQAFPAAQDLPVDPLGQVFDTCFVSEAPAPAVQASAIMASMSTSSVPEIPELPELPTLPIGEGLKPSNAGDELVLNADSSLYTKLIRQDNGYYLSPTTSEQAPQNLTVTIPGKDFPAFDAVALPASVPEFSLLSPIDVMALRSDSSFTWSTASAAKDTFVLLFGSSLSGGRFTCYAKDDGVFTFPSDTMMATVSFEGKLEGAARIRYSSKYKDKSFFMPMHGSLELYPDTSIIP
jgi:hypothetical protein